MIKLNGHTIGASFIQNFRKVFDLIEYEGPILSHFTDNNKKDYFYYWVDFDDICNRWLIWHVTSIELAKYVTGGISLRDLLLAQSKDFIYIADIESNLTYSSITAVDIAELPNQYIPEEMSYYQIEDEEDNPYVELIDAKKREFYENGLKTNSAFLKIVSKDKIHGSTVGLNEVNNFIGALTVSYKNFTQIDFTNSFKNKFSDQLKLNSIYKASNEAIGLRTTFLAVASFEIGLALDKTMLGALIEDDSIKSWASSVFDKYQKDVIDLDYRNDVEIERIIKSYTEEERSLIFQPLIKLSNNKKVKFCIRDKTNARVYKVITIEEKKALKIIPKYTKEIVDNEYELINAIVVVKKGEKKTTLTEANTLFTKRQNEYSYNITTEDFKKEGLDIDIDKEIEVEAAIHDNQFTLSSEINGKVISIKSDELKQAKSELLKVIFIELTK